MKKAPQWGLLICCVVVMLLALWPWNVWLVFGAAYASGLKRGNGWGLVAADTGRRQVQRAERFP
jgi:hypothetical protein